MPERVYIIIVAVVVAAAVVVITKRVKRRVLSTELSWLKTVGIIQGDKIRK